MGGQYERLIGFTKQTLYKSIGKSLLRFVRVRRSIIGCCNKPKQLTINIS